MEALRFTAAPTPELYLERAALLRELDPPQIDRALAGLDEGIRRLGPSHALVVTAIQLEVERSRWQEALTRSDALPKALLLRPEWPQRRSVWKREAGTTAAAVLP